ncbi:MAG: hypothetical protein LBH61_03525 [Dysgonamonadaceae bacterium]|jgi:hypothetical protein|nr:hypothetical protein [Dysgonamonadaceae bacterium]
MHVDFYGKDGWLYGWLSASEGNLFSIQICKVHKGNISICDLGAVGGLSDIAQIPAIEFNTPQPFYELFEYKTGNGYVIKLEMDRFKRPLYIRLYCGPVIEYQYSPSYPIILWRRHSLSYSY